MSPAGVGSRIHRYEPEAGMLSNVVAVGGFATCVSMADDKSLDIAGQVGQTLAYIDHCLSLVGVERDSLVQVTILLSDIRHREALNKVWTRWLAGAAPPARACVEARLADPRYLVEMIAVAALHPGAGK
jgi:enamine deaminase RidA (YjgF/YER057c/UK114 family)